MLAVTSIVTSLASGAFMETVVFGNAMVIDAKKNVISGPVVTIEPKLGVAHVVGPGTMHAMQEQADGTRPRPMNCAWIKGADMYGPEDRVDIFGGVAIRTIDNDGTINDVIGDRVHIDLMKKAAPTTRPSTRPADTHPAAIAATQPSVRPADTRPTIATSQPSTRPAKKDAMADSMQMDIMKDKDVKTITIYGAGTSQAKVLSTLAEPDGKVLRQFLLLAPKIIYQMADAPDQAAKTLVVPSAGKMLMGDHRPPEKPKPGAAKGNDDESSSRGNTAFSWKKSLVYSERDREAVLNGDVYVKHRPDAKDGNEFEVLHSDQVAAWFESAKPAARPATNPATVPTTVPTTNVATRPARTTDPGGSMQAQAPCRRREGPDPPRRWIAYRRPGGLHPDHPLDDRPR